MKNSSEVGTVQMGVFADANEALRAFREHLRHASVRPKDTRGESLGSKSVGWWDDKRMCFRRVLLMRDNTVVDVYLFLERFIEMGGSGNATMHIAKAIDVALTSDALVVQRGRALKVPRILSIETTGAISEKATLTARIRVAVPENPQEEGSKEVEIVRTIPFDVPNLSPEDKAKSEKRISYQVTYITPGCVVVSKEVTFIVQPAVSSDSGSAS
jgi:hypothetical protein